MSILKLRARLASLLSKRAARRAQAKLDMLAARASRGPTVASSALDTGLEEMREAQRLLAGDEPARALQIVDTLIAAGHDDVVLIVLWAQAAAALGRYREALTVNASAIKLAEAGQHTKLATSCRTWHRELALHVARDS